MLNGKKLHILLVEDDPDHAAMILRHVRAADGGGLQAERAERLTDGVESLSRGSWDAVLLDLQLPDSRGLDTLVTMLGQAAEVPVIVLTSLGDKELAARALQQGAQDYLVKDQITSELLSRTVRHAMERKRIEGRLKTSLSDLARHAGELEQLNRKLQEQNSELDNFNHMISHDLREPIRHLMLFSERLKRSAGSALPEKADRDLKQVYAAARRMESCISGLRLLSQAGRDITRAPTPLDSCLHSALEDLEQPVGERRAAISFGSLPEVEGEPSLITLLLRNLISNALKYCSVTPMIHITAEQSGMQWVLGIRDNGIGIDPNYADRIFDPFQRLHGREEYGGGNGLGLAICKKIVEGHGGRIWVESSPGQGSHFRFTLRPDRENAGPREAPGLSASRI